MMKLFSRSLAALSLSVILFGCSEGNYTPPPATTGAGTTGQAGYVNPNLGPNNPNYNSNYNPTANPNYNNTNNGMPCTSACTPKPPCPYTVRPGANPYFTYNAQQLAQMNAQANFQFQLRLQANAMWSWSNRAANPDFYIAPPVPPTQPCVLLRTYPTYTPTSCACITSPCNCQEVIKKLCPYYRKKTCKKCVVKQETKNPLVLPTIPDSDAIALFNRLSVAPTLVKTANSTRETRVGINYECTKETLNNAPNDSKYLCDMNVSTEVNEKGEFGVVLEMSSPGQPIKSNFPVEASYENGPIVSIGPSEKLHLQKDEGIITLTGQSAKALNDVLTDGSSTADTLNGRDFTCTTSVDPKNSDQTQTVCTIHIQPSTGKVLRPKMDSNLKYGSDQGDQSPQVNPSRKDDAVDSSDQNS